MVVALVPFQNPSKIKNSKHFQKEIIKLKSSSKSKIKLKIKFKSRIPNNKIIIRCYKE